MQIDFINCFVNVKVKVLLKECEEARGSVVSTTSSIALDELTQSYDEVSSSSEVISKRLVTFRYFYKIKMWLFYILVHHVAIMLIGEYVVRCCVIF